jgi:hypothetical protein
MARSSPDVLKEPAEGLASKLDASTPDLLSCPATEATATRADTSANVLRERSLDGSALCTDERTVTPDGNVSFDPDLVMVACFVDALLDALGVEAGAEGSVKTARDLFAEVYAAAFALPVLRLDTDAVAGPDAAGHLTSTLRAAAGVEAAGPPSWADASQLARQTIARGLQSLGLSQKDITWLLGRSAPTTDDIDKDPDDDSDYTRAGDELWGESDEDAADPAAFENEPDPPADEPWIAASQSPQNAVQPSGIAAAGALLRPLSRKNWKRLMKFGLPKSTRKELSEWVRLRRESGEIRPHSQNDGFIAEKALLTIYLIERQKVAAQILAGRRVGNVSIDDVAAAGGIWGTVKTALLSLVTNAVGQPDILDPDLREVYEIKPKAQAVRGAHQLYGRYLLFLNAWEVYSTIPGTPPRRALAWAARVAAAFSSYVGQGAFPAIDLSGIGPARFWTPGTWTPPRRIVLLDRRLMDVEVPIPGVLCYQILGKKDSDDGHGSTVPVDLRSLAVTMAMLMLAQAAADAANQTGGASGVEAVARAAGVPQPDGDKLRTALLVVGKIVEVELTLEYVKLRAAKAALAELVLAAAAWLAAEAAAAVSLAAIAAGAFSGMLVAPDHIRKRFGYDDQSA